MVRHNIFFLSLIFPPIHPCPAVAMLQAYVGGKKTLVLLSAFFLKGKKTQKTKTHIAYIDNWSQALCFPFFLY